MKKCIKNTVKSMNVINNYILLTNRSTVVSKYSKIFLFTFYKCACIIKT